MEKNDAFDRPFFNSIARTLLIRNAKTAGVVGFLGGVGNGMECLGPRVMLE